MYIKTPGNQWLFDTIPQSTVTRVEWTMTSTEIHYAKDGKADLLTF